jgi:aminopeptidase N
MRDASPGTIYLKDYVPPDYLIEKTELHFELGEESTLVHAVLHVQRNEHVSSEAALILHGQELELLSLCIDDRALESGEFEQGLESLTVPGVPAQFELRSTTRIYPQDNTSLEGLYKSRTMYCTQCEAEGFRKITYYLDRPDVMSVFTVAIDADPRLYPVLLSNGNLQAIQKLPNGFQRAVWHDPFPKPAYLFALVAGELEFNEDSFTTISGREVTLRIYVEEKDLDKCDHAMLSLQQSMRWDEDVYGREYDLDIFNIVAVDDFNMGAMENKSLNIFNTSCVLCSQDITTDMGFQRVQAIVAHEYFHNWSGNRVTCRDWFQLSLKEGFTVFRDSQFSADMTSPTVKRVEDVTLLRTAQFAEDAGPMAHPIRPDSYMEINNFYTLTVYEKGAEVVRMIHTLLGAEAFRRGSDLYFERHDGQAATCEDFVVAMEEASGVDLTQFRNWYSQAGTPELAVTDAWDESTGEYALTVTQSCAPTAGQKDKAPYVIPLAMGLLGDAGALPLKLKGEEGSHETSDNTHRVLTLDQPAHTFVFEGLPERPVPSLLRGFSAPVRLKYDYSNSDLRSLMSRDDDGFVRWDSAQTLATNSINALQDALAAGEELSLEPLLAEACVDLLRDESLDPAMVAAMLRLPAENTLAELASHQGGADVDAIHGAREFLKAALGRHLNELLEARYHQLEAEGAYSPDAEQVARRSLRNVCLDYLVAGDTRYLEMATRQFNSADNMTDRLAALYVLGNYGDEGTREKALASFHRDWRHEGLVVNQWLQVQASLPDDAALARVKALMQHADFDIRNPNKVRSLIGVFSGQNPVNFHRADGEGYRFLADAVLELNGSNPQIAARLLAPLTKWRMYPGREELMKAQLQRLADADGLSPDVFEVVQKSLVQ